MEQKIPFSESNNTGSNKTLFITLGAIVAVIVIAFFATKGGGLKGSFLSETPNVNLAVSVDNATFLKSGDLAVTYSMKNNGATIADKQFGISFEAFVNRVKTPTFVKPWNDQNPSVTELRTGEKVTYSTVIPQSMFPKEVYGVTNSDLPPSIGLIKTVEVALFGLNSNNVKEKIATSNEFLPIIEK